MAFVHVILRVTDIGRSINFYSRLGLSVARRMSTDDHPIAFTGDGKGSVNYPFVFIGFTNEDAEALARILNEKCLGPNSSGPSVEF